MINYLPPKQRNQNLLSSLRKIFLNLSFKNLLDKETNLLNKLPELDSNLETKFTNFLIVFTLFLTTFTVIIGFYSSVYFQTPSDGNYNISKAKNFLFLNANSLQKIEKDTALLQNYLNAYELTQKSDSKIITILSRVHTEFSKGSEIKGLSLRGTPSGYEYTFRLVPDARDFLTFIESIKTYYPQLEDISYQESADDQEGIILVTGNIKYDL